MFKSVELADNDGQFPIKNFIDRSNDLNQTLANSPLENLKKQFELLKDVCPEFVTCQNSIMTILNGIISKNEALSFDKCVINRVYKKLDQSKQPIMYVYVKSDELWEKFYFVDNDTGTFIEQTPEEFVKVYVILKNMRLNLIKRIA